MRRNGWLIGLVGTVLVFTLGGCATAPATASPQIPTTPAAPTTGASTGEVTVAPVAEAQTPAVEPAPVEEPAQPGIRVVSGSFMPVPIEALVNGDIVTIPLAAVQDAVNSQFSVTLDDRLLDFMAYTIDDLLFVRASACPPCNSQTFALDGDHLVCESCSTVFDALTGEGLDGACVDYPKAVITCEVGDGVVRMDAAELVRAYDETLAPGSEPVVPESVEEEEPEVDTRPPCCR